MDIPGIEELPVSFGADIPFMPLIPCIGDDLVELSRADLWRTESGCAG